MAQSKKVRVGKEYIYQPVGLDRWDARTTLKAGDRVKVVNQRGCPPANTMGHCYVTLNGEFKGLILTNSLTDIEPDLDAEEDEEWNSRIRSGAMKQI